MEYLSHSGDLGDIIFALPAVRALGVRTLYLLDLPSVRTRARMDQARAEVIAPLLRCQNYLDQVIWTDDPAKDTPLNHFRDTLVHVKHIAGAHLLHMGLLPSEAQSKWLTVTPRPVAEIVISRSRFYQQERFPWAEYLRHFDKKNMAFVGTKEEYAEFCGRFHVEVTPYGTKTLLDLAEVIGGSRLFIGNQSCPAAIAEGLKHPMISECWPNSPDTLCKRAGRIDILDGLFRI